MNTWFRLVVVAGICASSGWAVDWKALRPQPGVSDFAGVIDARTKTELQQYCSQVQASTGVRISFVTLASLEGEPINEVGPAIFQAWGVPNPDDLVLLVLAVAERRHWLGTGSTLPQALTDGLDGRILREAAPALRQKDYGETLKAAAETIGAGAARVRHVAAIAPPERRIRPTTADSIPWIVLAGVAVVMLWLLLAGNPSGYGGFTRRGLLAALVSQNTMGRSTWGSRGSGGFGGYDSGDSSGGFGGGACRDW
jgi:uncharacterized protein